MKADIITVGAITAQTEQFLTQELAAFDFAVTGHRHIDNPEALPDALREAMRHSERIVICGGLESGAAAMVAGVLGLPLQPNEACQRRLEDYLTATDSTPSALPTQSDHLPATAVPFVNEQGIFPGFAVEKYGQMILLLPAPVNELFPMFQKSVIPYLTEKTNGSLATHTVGVFGLSEAAVTERLSDLMAGVHPSLLLFPQDGGEILLRVTARALTEEAAQAACQPVVTEIQERLGSFVYGVDVSSLQMAVVHLLLEKQMKIATAESCTAGLLSGKLTQVSGASCVFECGIAAYSKEIKRDVLGVSNEILETQGAVCADTARDMATGVRRVGGSHLGVSITGEAGPSSGDGKPVGTVFIALADNRRVWVKEIHATGVDRDIVRQIATAHALDLVRRYLEAIPTVMAGGQLLDETAGEVVIPKAPATKKRRALAILFPWKGDSAGWFITKLLLWLLLLAMLALSVWHIRYRVVDPALNREQYVSLELLYEQGITNNLNSEDFPEGMLSRFYALYEKNADIRGWVRIADTGISYPVMQSGLRNYASLNFSKQPSSYGVPFFDENVALASAQSVNRSYIIHGNNTRDGQMFSDLLQYTDANFLLQHPTIEMNTVFSTGTYEVFAVLYVDENDDTFDYRVSTFDSNEEFLAFTEALQERSLFITSVTPKKEDTLLLLETDASHETKTAGIRLVVAARRLPLGISSTEKLEISRNRDVLLPQAMYPNNSTTTATAATTTVQNSSDIVPELPMPEDPIISETTTSASTAVTTTTTTTVHTTTTTTTATTTATHTTSSSVSTVTTTTTTTGTTTVPVTTTTTATTTTAPETTVTTTTTTTVPPATPAPGNEPEAAFYTSFKVKIGNDAATTLQSREDLQYAVACVVKAELGAARSMAHSTEAQKAQAVASYTYMLYSCAGGKTFSISSRIDLQNQNDRKIYDAVGDVVGVKMMDTATNKPLMAMYCASSGGATASCQNVYTAALPYLQSVESVYDTEEYIAQYSGNDTLTDTYTITWSDLQALLCAYVTEDTDGDVTEIFFEEDGDTPLYARSYDGDSGYVVDTNVYYIHEGETVYLRGIDIRKAIGSGTLRSHHFTLDYNSTSDQLTFTTMGHGHGLGLSQYGAIGYANEAGWTYQQILSHYYSLSEGGRYCLVDPLWE